MKVDQHALFFSVLSRGWAAGLQLLAVPIYVEYLGIEAYGVVGLFASFAVIVGFMDLGLGASLTRELARFSAKKISIEDSRNNLRTFEIAYAMIALMIALFVTFFSEPIAFYWFQVENINRSDIAQALFLAGVSLACQWPINLFNSGLAGLHRQNQLSIATIVFATLRFSITLTAIWIQPSLQTFFCAQIFSAVMQAVGIRWLLWRNLTLASHRPIFRASTIQSTLRFASGMTGISITSVILTQTDKIILSKALTLNDFGLYVLAGTLASGLYMFISPLFSLVFPRFSSLIHSEQDSKLKDLYLSSAQTMAALIIPSTLLIAIFPLEVLYVWTGNIGINQEISWILALLIIGNGLNGIMNIPYALQLAAGWTSLSFWINVCAITLLIPIIWWAAINYGGIGGAAVWAALNLIYVIITPQIMHRRLIPNAKNQWYCMGLIIPLVLCISLLMSFRMLEQTLESRLFVAISLTTYYIITVVITVLVLPQTRLKLIDLIKK
jgi:O-antigen/teichoic acid export membrane protein